jgi:N-acetylated-alpha-linked acidic dipeptidase
MPPSTLAPAVLLAALGLLPAPPGAGDPPSRGLLLELTAEARLAGTTGSRFGADVVRRHLERAGFEVELDDRVVLLSLPRRIDFAVFEDGFATRALLERTAAFDPDAVPPGDVPPFSAWAASGDVRGAVVDVGYGLRDDYQRLADGGIDVRGRVVLARCGHAYRGVKVDLAAQHGAIAVLLFSDPADDGAARGPTWPDGPWKPDWAVQRGSISPMGRSPGDPSTPGWPSPAPGEEAPRLDQAALAAALPRIPCLPIGARDAQPILERLAPRHLAGADPAETARIGPGPVEVHLALDQPRELRTIRNVIGRLAGSGPDVVIAGNHRDAWVRGANDAGSGTVALLRAAEQLGERARGGWRPRSSILLAFWDAEEQGLVGSTEWSEAHADWLAEHLVAYVNADTAVGGTHLAHVSGAPGLLGALRAALERVPAAPDAKDGAATLWDELVAHADGGTPRLGLPGSGSDFAVFLHHLGLPVLDPSLGGGHGGQYHTAFDDFPMVERYLDPGFAGHEIAGRMYAELLTELAERGRDAFDPSEAARALAEHAREAGETPPPGVEPGAWQAATARVAAAFDAVAGAPPERVRRDLYARLAAPDGLPGRPWFTNRLWAPGLETGYSSELFPTLRAAALGGTLDAEVSGLVAAVEALVSPAPVREVPPPETGGR